MSIQVRYHKTDLETEAEYDVFEADMFFVHDDNTLELRQGTHVVGFVHPERWDSVYYFDEAQVE